MDHRITSGDLENGLTKSNGQSQCKVIIGSSKSLDETFFAKILGNLTPIDESDTSSVKSSKSDDGDDEKVGGLLRNKNSDGTEENVKIESWNHELTSKKIKKASKPPRPPRHPSFDAAADKKLVREIAELARRERARLERNKSARKIKTAKSSSLSLSSSSSSSSNLVSFAMFVTLLIFVIILFHGISSKSMEIANLEGY